MAPPRTLLAVALAAVVTAGAVWTVLRADYGYILWSDRDMWRTARLLEDWPVAGAEMNYGSGGRLPGGAWHLLTWPPLALRGEPVDVWRMLTLLDLAAAAALALTAARRWGPLSGAVALALWFAPTDVRSTMDWLWNPMLLPGAVAAALVLLDRALRPDAGRAAWALAGAVTAVGAQAHFTALSWAAATLTTLLVLAPRPTTRGLPAWTLGLVVPYLPWLWREVTTGGAEAARLLDQSTGPVDPASLPAELAEVAAMWVPAVTDAEALAAPGVAVLAGATVGAALSWRSPRADPVTAASAVAAATLLLAPPLLAGVRVEERYLLAALPPLCWLAARAAAGPLGPLLALCAAASPIAVLWRATTPVGAHPVHDGQALLALVDQLADATGDRHAGHAALAGRLVLLVDRDGAPALPEPTPFELRLLQEGSTFPGSLPGPCFAVFAAGRPADPAAALRAATGVDARVLDEGPSAHGAWRVTWQPSPDRCPTTASNRYVDLPEEALARAHFAALTAARYPEARAARRDHDGGVEVALGATLATPDGARLPLTVGLDLRPGPGVLTARWSSHQLRGHAYNGGWFTDLAARDPALVLTDGAGVETVAPLHHGVVGPGGVVPPWTTVIRLAPGRYRVAWRAAEVSGVDRGRPRPGQAVELPADVVVDIPPGP